MERRSFFKLSPFALIGLCFYASLVASIWLGAAGLITEYGAPWWCATMFTAFVLWVHGIPAAHETKP